MHVPVTSKTVFKVGSISKQFVAAAIIELVRDKKLALDDGIGKYLDEIPASWKNITIRQMMNHIGGIPDYTDSELHAKRQANDVTEKDIFATIVDTPLNFAPGTHWQYSNSDQFVAGMILERVSHTSIV